MRLYRDAELLITATPTTSSTTRLNVAATANGATATASSFDPDNTFGPNTHTRPSDAIDGTHALTEVTYGTGYWRSHPLSQWLEVDFSGAKSITEIDLYTMRDNYTSQSEVTASETFTQYGATDFSLKYWDGASWVAIAGGTVTGNNQVWRKLTFGAITTTKIRVDVSGAPDGVARVAELEAYEVSSGAAGEGEVNRLVADQLGTPRMILEQSGSLSAEKRHDYLPFGEELSAGTGVRTTNQGYVRDSNPYKFAQLRRDDETGLDYAQARYYGSTLGRFTSVDPENTGARNDDPQSWNGYAYARNNPLLYTDPDGLLYRIRHADGSEEIVTDEQFDQIKNNPHNGELGIVVKGGTIYHTDNDGNLVASGTYERIWFDDLTDQANYAIWGVAARSPAMQKVILGFAAANLLPASGIVVADMLGGVGLITLGNLSRAAPAAGAGSTVLNQLSRTDAGIFEKAAEYGASAQNAFMNNLQALTQAVQNFRADAQITKIGQIGSSPVMGSLASRVGIAEVNGVTVIVKMVHGNPQILGPLPW